MQSLQELENKIKSCTACQLSESRTQVVPGEGNPDADVMFIGEGPGKNEDLQGRPFVGAAGKLLDEMLQQNNLQREDVYIANVVKCRPPNNRDPLPAEVRTCWSWLEKQISIIQPRLIVLLGRHSLQRFLPKARITEHHGRALRKEFPPFGKLVFFPCYHPAAALYNGGLRSTLFSDFAKIPKVVEIIKEEEKNNSPQEEEKHSQSSLL
ncbi:MAG: uracil-DNA glycosylase [Candidatus Moranbacteria bacterium]|nr:uracil-DNA glycosylase [Candidatus Moranbacteria bacterium]